MQFLMIVIRYKDFFSLHFCKKPFIGEINVTGINPNEIDLFKKSFEAKLKK